MTGWELAFVVGRRCLLCGPQNVTEASSIHLVKGARSKSQCELTTDISTLLT